MDEDRGQALGQNRPMIDPVEMARRDLKRILPRRFWTEAAAVPLGHGFGVALDGKPVSTPAKARLVVPTRALAEALAAEWRTQGEVIEPQSMPLTRLANTSIDGVAGAFDATVAETAKFAESDLVCYRAGDPEALVAAQAKAWDPVLVFARENLDARLICVEGVIYVAQPETALAAVRTAVREAASGEAGALRLAALNVMTALTGSVLIALAVVRGVMPVEVAWAAAHVDEDYQRQVWGADAEAAARRECRWRDMRAAAEVYALSA